MARNYYSLVAGLREYTLDAESKGFDARSIIDEVESELSDADKRYLRLFYNFYDIENIINIVAGRLQFNMLGNYSREELEKEVQNPENLPDYISDVLLAYKNTENTDFEDIDHSKPIEKSLFEAFYRECSKSGNKFIREWYEFDRNLRNLLAAYAARKAGITISEELVGEGYVTDVISRSSAADFGLKGELSYIDDVLNAVGNETNLLEKERKLDLIRWNTSDELTVFDYFDMNYILGYLIKVNLVHRWISLDEKYGREMFQKLISSLSNIEMEQE